MTTDHRLRPLSLARLSLSSLDYRLFGSPGKAQLILFSFCVSPKGFRIAKAEAGSHDGWWMSSQASGLRVASVIFALFAIGHVVRLVRQAQVTVGTYQIPMWVSVVALIIAAILSTWMWRLSSARR